MTFGAFYRHGGDGKLWEVETVVLTVGSPASELPFGPGDLRIVTLHPWEA